MVRYEKKRPEQACFLRPSSNKDYIKYTKTINSNSHYERLIIAHTHTPTFEHLQQTQTLAFDY